MRATFKPGTLLQIYAIKSNHNTIRAGHKGSTHLALKMRCESKPGTLLLCYASKPKQNTPNTPDTTVTGHKGSTHLALKMRATSKPGTLRCSAISWLTLSARRSGCVGMRPPDA
jgi:hypothetical protein